MTPELIQILLDAIEAVRSRQFCHGTHDGEMIGNAFEQLHQEITDRLSTDEKLLS